MRILIALFLLFNLNLWASGAPGNGVCVGLFNLRATEGKEEECILSRGSENSPYLILDFFSTTYPTFREEASSLQKISNAEGNKVFIRLVALDRQESTIRQYLAQNPELNSFSVGWDNFQAAKNAYEVNTTPSLFVLDSENHIVFKRVGTLSPADIEQIENTIGSNSKAVQVPVSLQTKKLPNLRIRFSTRLLNSAAMSKEIDRKETIQDEILGTDILSSTHTKGKVVPLPAGSNQGAALDFDFTALTSAQSVGYNGPAAIYSSSNTATHAIKRIVLEPTGVRVLPARAACRTASRIEDVEVARRLGWRIAERIAWRRALGMQCEANQIAESHAELRFASTLDGQFEKVAGTSIHDMNQFYQDKVYRPLQQRGLFPEWIHVFSSKSAFGLEAIKASADQLGAEAPAPAVLGNGSGISIQVHASFFENFGGRWLAGKVDKDEKFERDIQAISGEVPPELRVYEGTTPWQVTWSHSHPVRASFQDNKITIRLFLDTFSVSDQVFEKKVEIAMQYGVDTSSGVGKLKRIGKVSLRYLPPLAESPADDKALAFLEKKFNAFFSEEPNFNALTIPNGTEFDKLSKLRLVAAQMQGDWINLSFQDPTE